jgi:hypothetical protein
MDATPPMSPRSSPTWSRACATCDQLLNLLGRAQSVSDILTVQDRLHGVTGEIEK